MFGFGKKKQGTKGLKEKAALQEENMELGELAETYYELGKAYAEKGDSERARLYLERSSTLYSNFDQVCGSSEDFMDDCNERIGALEAKPLLGNKILEQVKEKSELLSNAQKYYWGLLSLARFQAVFQHLAGCQNCRILGEFSQVMDMLCRAVGQESQVEELDYSLDFITRFYDFCDSEAFVDTKNQAELGQGAPFQLFDLNGNSTVTLMHLFVDKFISVLRDGFGTVEGNEEAEVGFVPCTLLMDYYLRTREGDIQEIPQVRAEFNRIWSDYDFVKSHPVPQDVLHRLEQYRKLDILK